MGMSVAANTKHKSTAHSAAPGDTVTVTLGVEEAQNLVLALTDALGGGGSKGKDKKKKKDVKEPPFGK
jgi:hypothetical protein